MKRFVSVFLIFLLLSFNLNMITSFAESEGKSFTQGLYQVKDIGLAANTSYNIKNVSPSSSSIVIVVDENNLIQELIRLEPNSPNYILKPLNFNSIIIVVGSGTVAFS